MRKRIPDWLLERHALGELPPDREAEILSRMAGRPEEEERLRALREDDRAFLERHPPRAVAASIRARLGEREERSRRDLRRPAFASLAAAASLALAVAVLLPGGEEEEIRTKGLAPSILMHRSQGGEIVRLQDGATAREGDLVQLSYLAAGKRFGVVLSIDGNGVVSLHYPLGGEWAAELRPEGAIALPHAYELDAAPEFERFYFLASDAPFRVREVVEAARRAAPGSHRLPLGDEIVQTSFLLRKP